MQTKDELIRSLVHWLAQGKLDARNVLPALQQLAEDSTPPSSLLEVLQTVVSKPEAGWIPLQRQLRETCWRLALSGNASLADGRAVPEDVTLALKGLPWNAPLQWQAAPAREPLGSALAAAEDWLLVQAYGTRAPVTLQMVHDHLRRTSVAAVRQLSACGGILEAGWLDAESVKGAQPWPEQVLNTLRQALAQRQQTDAVRADEAVAGGRAPLPEEVNQAAALEQWRQRWQQTADDAGKRPLLDMLCSWPSAQAAPTILEVVQPGWMQERALLILALRFGHAWLNTWNGWRQWLSQADKEWELRARALAGLARANAVAVLWAWYQNTATPDLATLQWLQGRMVEGLKADCWQGFAARWAGRIPADERTCFGLAAEVVPTPFEAAPVMVAPTATGPGQAALAPAPARQRHTAPPPLPASATPPASRAAVTPPPLPSAPARRPTAAPRGPSIWEEHIQPFFAANWYFLAGIGMVIVGSSLVAFYTWDKHWLVRYSIMPALLAFFTWTLARVGQWIEQRGPQFRATAATLRGAAIGLLPVNFMAVALLSGDEGVARKGLAISIMALFYLGFFGWGLRRWCGAVHPALGSVLGTALLAINALVALGPLARTVGGVVGDRLWFLMGVGFHAGFFLVAGVVVWFSRRVLTRELAEEKRVPWFLGATLALTFLQVFAWVHSYMQHMPRAHTYGPAIILAGGLALFAERVGLQFHPAPRQHRAESFLGFALIMLGLLMSAAQPQVRILGFLLAGAVWLWQGLLREHPLHSWVALTLFVLGGASVTLLDRFPGVWRPAAGLVLALAMILTQRLSAGRGWRELAKASQGMQAALLTLTAMVAVLTQWHYRSAPFLTAVWLAAVAGVLVWQALRDQELHWLHTAMVMLALTLPYLGFVDMTQRTLHDNTMVFGLACLSWLWLGANALFRHPLIRQARSTVLCFYGFLGLAAMVLRVTLGGAAPNTQWYRDYMEYLGPFLMTGVLVLATYYSRSLLFAGMAVAINVILFPELRANLRQTLPGMAWGTGLGSAISALGLIMLCFRLRLWPFLKELGEGDRFLGRQQFPWRRSDHTLFTIPLVVSVLYLTLRVDAWDFARNWTGGQLRLQTAGAVFLSGLVWTLLAVFRRADRRAGWLVHMGWFYGAVGLSCWYWRQAPDPHWSWPLLLTGLWLQGLFSLYHHGLEKPHPWAREFLTEPIRGVLRVGSLLLLTAGAVVLVVGTDLGQMKWLLLFLSAQGIWHGLEKREPAFGTILFFVLWFALLAGTNPGSGSLLERVTVARSLTPTLGLVLGIQVILIWLEKPRAFYDRVMPLLQPMFLLGSGLICLLGVVDLFDVMQWLGFLPLQQALLLGALLLTARAHRSAPILLLVMLLAYALAPSAELEKLSTGLIVYDPYDRILLLAMPWRLAVLSLAMVLGLQAGRWMQSRCPVLFEGAYPHPLFTAPSSRWVYDPAVLLACAAALYHTIDPAYRESAAQVWTPYLGAAACAAVAGFWQKPGYFGFAGPLVLLGNLHLVRVFAGNWLRDQGLSEIHLLCLGLSLGLGQCSLVRLWMRAKTVGVLLNRSSLALAGLVLGLLSANYLGAPNLETVAPWRFVVSGIMAGLAGWYFRRAARHPGPGETAYVNHTEGLYHFGMVLAIWCGALLVPWMRQPGLALVALSLPLFFFYARAEMGVRLGRPEAGRYRNSAAVLGFVITGLYVFRGVFHMVLFPATPIATEHYHQNALLLMILSLVLLRLHGLGGTAWLAFYGGLALMGGSYFLLTALPGLSPFTHPIAAAWSAVGLGHFWILLSYNHSPLRTAIQQMAALSDPPWHRLRRAWGRCLLAAIHGAVLWGVTAYRLHPEMLAPLLVGAASILVHQGAIRHSPVYLAVAALEVVLALHMDFLVESWLGREHVIWVLLEIGLAVRVAQAFKPAWLTGKHLGLATAVLAALTFGHVLYHEPWSATGLWAVALLALLVASHPLASCPSEQAGERGSAWILPTVPVWLVYFSQAPIPAQGWAGAVAAWPVLATTMALLLTGVAAEAYQARWASRHHAWVRSRFYLCDQMLAGLERNGAHLHLGALVCVLVLAVAMQVAHYQTAYAPRECVLLTALYLGSAVAWLRRSRQAPSLVSSYLMQLCAVGALAAIRRQLMLTTDLWSYEYDVWASLAISFLLSGTKRLFENQPRPVQLSLLTSLCALPVMAIVWVLVHGLGANLALLVVGLHSLMFAYLGKDDRESPFNMVAVGGFVLFVGLTFWTKLHFQAVHAYVIPVGLGVLVLLHLLRERIAPPTRNVIRWITLLAMLGSAGYYALADSRYPVAFNLTVILLSLLAMGLGSLLRVRIYLALGFTGLMVDLGTLFSKAVVHAERSVRMTVVGILVLVLGALLVFGAIYYRTNKETIDAWFGRWREKFGGWE